MKSNKHIVWISPGFATDEADDFTVPTLQQLALAMKNSAEAPRFTIVSLHYPFQKAKRKWNDINVVDIGARNKSFPFRFFSWYETLNTLREIHATDKIDLIHSFWYSETALLAGRFAEKMKLPHVCTAVGQSTRGDNRYIPLLKNKKIVLVGECTRQHHPSAVEMDEIIPWGLEPQAPATEEKSIDIIGAGNFSRLKNYQLFIEVVAEVNKYFPRLKVLLAGDGPQKNELSERCRWLGLENNVVFTGRISRREVLQQMQRSKVFLHTSLFESYGYVFAEAAAAGCYIVSTPVGAVHEFRNAFSSSDKMKLAEKIITYLNKPQLTEEIYFPKIGDTALSYLQLYDKMINEFKH